MIKRICRFFKKFIKYVFCHMIIYFPNLFIWCIMNWSQIFLIFWSIIINRLIYFFRNFCFPFINWFVLNIYFYCSRFFETGIYSFLLLIFECFCKWIFIRSFLWSWLYNYFMLRFFKIFVVFPLFVYCVNLILKIIDHHNHIFGNYFWFFSNVNFSRFSFNLI